MLRMIRTALARALHLRMPPLIRAALVAIHDPVVRKKNTHSGSANSGTASRTKMPTVRTFRPTIAA
jgi:hypothetical protein